MANSDSWGTLPHRTDICDQGQWSRLDYQRDPRQHGPSAIREFVATLPKGARALYYRDEIGNISTSAVYVHVQRLPRSASVRSVDNYLHHQCNLCTKGAGKCSGPA